MKGIGRQIVVVDERQVALLLCVRMGHRPVTAQRPQEILVAGDGWLDQSQPAQHVVNISADDQTGSTMIPHGLGAGA